MIESGCDVQAAKVSMFLEAENISASEHPRMVARGVANSRPWRGAQMYTRHRNAQRPQRHLELHSGLGVVCSLSLIGLEGRRAYLEEQ